MSTLPALRNRGTAPISNPTFGSVPSDTILVGDCINHLRQLPDNCVDLVFADPPYNLQLRRDLHRPDHSPVDAVRNDWDHFPSFEAYDAASTAWLTECRRVLKPDGAIWVIGSYHNVFRLGTSLQNLGFWILNDVIWTKSNPMPNFRGRRFTNAHETLIWASREEKSNYTFNYQAMKVLNDDTQMRSDWYLPLCTGGERLRSESGEKIHPTQKPESLLMRIIIATTRPGDLVLDPFFGTGTTGVAAKKLGRRWLGIEQDKTYAEAADRRIASVSTISPKLLEVTPSAAHQKRIPFGVLIEQGVLSPGQELLGGSSGQHRAVVRVDGSLACGDISGSIHKTGAQLEGKPSCNGWHYWHIAQGENLHPINALREQIRAEFNAVAAEDEET